MAPFVLGVSLDRTFLGGTMTSRSRSFWHIWLAVMAACGGQTNPPVNENIDAKWRQYCTQESARETACGGTPKASCPDDGACLVGVLRAGVIDSLTSCLLARTCGANDDACYATAAAPHQSEPEVSDYTATCIAKHDACAQTG